MTVTADLPPAGAAPGTARTRAARSPGRSEWPGRRQRRFGSRPVSADLRAAIASPGIRGLGEFNPLAGKLAGHTTGGR
jgi:hypothetical protein